MANLVSDYLIRKVTSNQSLYFSQFKSSSSTSSTLSWHEEHAIFKLAKKIVMEYDRMMESCQGTLTEMYLCANKFDQGKKIEIKEIKSSCCSLLYSMFC